MTILGLEVGTWAEVAGALAGVAGVLLSLYALRSARHANAVAEQVRLDARTAADLAAKRDLERDEEQRERERRELAGSVAAWWAALQVTPASDGHEAKHRWGVVISNQNVAQALYFKVTVYATAFDQVTYEIPLSVLPPGRYFVKLFPSGSQRPGFDGVPEPVAPSDILSPLTMAKKVSIERITYQDALGTPWRWSPDSGLQRDDDPGHHRNPAPTPRS